MAELLNPVGVDLRNMSPEARIKFLAAANEPVKFKGKYARANPYGPIDSAEAIADPVNNVYFGKYYFPAVARESSLRELIPAKDKRGDSTLQDEMINGFHNWYHALDYDTEEEKAVVDALVARWKENFRAVEPNAFVKRDAGESNGLDSFLFKMDKGAGLQAERIWGPDGFEAVKFRDAVRPEHVAKSVENNIASAADRTMVAREVLESGMDIMDPHTVFARDELKKMGGAFVVRGTGKNAVKGWVIAPPSTLNEEVWGQDIQQATDAVYEAREMKGTGKYLTEAQMLLVIEAGLSKVAFGFEAKSYNDINHLGRLEIFRAMRSAEAAYSKAYNENAEIREQARLAGKEIPEAFGFRSDSNPDYRFPTILLAAKEQLEIKREKAGLDDVINTTKDSFGKDNDMRVGPYTRSVDITSKAKALSRGDDAEGALASKIEQIEKALDGAPYTAISAAKPMVITGAPVAFNQDWVVFSQTSMKDGVEQLEYFKLLRSDFINNVYKKDAPPFFTNNPDFREKAIALFQRACDESVSVGGLLNDKTLEAMVAEKKQISIGMHAGVLVAVGLKQMAEKELGYDGMTPEQQDKIAIKMRNADKNWDAKPEEERIAILRDLYRPWKTQTEAQKQEAVLERIATEVEFAGKFNIEKMLKAKQPPALPALPANATDEQKADHAAREERANRAYADRQAQIKTNGNKVVEEALKVLAPMQKEIEAKAEAAFAQRGAQANADLADGRSNPRAVSPTPQVPKPFREGTISANRTPIIGHISDVKGELVLVEELKVLRKGSRGVEGVFEPTGMHFIFNKHDSADEFANDSIASSYKAKGDEIYNVRRNIDRVTTEEFAEEAKKAGRAINYEDLRTEITRRLDGVPQYHTMTFGFSVQGNLVAMKGSYDDQIAIDQKAKYFAEQPRIVRAPKEAEARNERYDSDLFKVVSQAESDRRQRIDDAILQVQQTLVQKKGKDISKIVAESGMSMQQAINEAGVVTLTVGTNHPSLARDRMHVMEAPITEMVADVNKILKGDGLTIVSAYDQANSVMRVFPLEFINHEKLNIKNSENVIDPRTGQKVGKTYAREIQEGDQLEMTSHGTDEKGRTEYKMEIIDPVVELALARQREAEEDKNRSEEERIRIRAMATDRINAAGIPSGISAPRVTLNDEQRAVIARTTMRHLNSNENANIKRIQMIQPDTNAGMYSGVTKLVDAGNGQRWIAMFEPNEPTNEYRVAEKEMLLSDIGLAKMVENHQETIRNPQGVAKMLEIVDADVVSKAFQKNGRGENADGGHMTVRFKDGRIVDTNFKTKQQVVLELKERIEQADLSAELRATYAPEAEQTGISSGRGH